MKNLKAMLSSEDMTWETPQDLFDELNEEFNFNLDPCATVETAKCKIFFTKEADGLSKDWCVSDFNGGKVAGRVFMNPPYGTEIKKWIKKASEEIKTNAEIVVCLIPARTDTRYFHDYIYKKSNVEIRFIKGRIKFGGKQKVSGSAPFPSMLVIFTS